MLNKTSKQFKIDFISEFTREILRGTDSYIHVKIKESAKTPLAGRKFKDTGKTKEEKKDIKKIVSEKLEKDKEVYKKSSLEKEDWIPSKILRDFTKEKRNSKPNFKIINPHLNIPRISVQEPRLPETVSYIKPVANNKSINLGKLNPLVRDPLVKTIETEGPNQPVFVTGMMGHKPTKIKLNQEEIQSTIKRFSEEAKIPLEDGFFKAAVGNLAISAIVSESTGSKLIITKIGSTIPNRN